jgi:hypothetical protein
MPAWAQQNPSDLSRATNDGAVSERPRSVAVYGSIVDLAEAVDDQDLRLDLLALLTEQLMRAREEGAALDEQE